VHHVLLRRGLNIFVSHRLYRLLLSPQLVLEDLKLDSVLGDLLLLLLKCSFEPLHLVPDALLVGLKEADLLGVELVVLTLLPDRQRPPIECLSLHTVALYLLLKRVVQVHDLRLLLFELGLLLLESALLRRQILALVLGVLQLLAQLQLGQVHLLAEVLPGDFDLLELDLELLHLLNGLLLLAMSGHPHTLFIRLRPLDFDFEVDGAVPDVAVGGRRSGVLVLDVLVALLFLLLVLLSRLLLPQG